ncbi:MAG: response regulator [Caldilineaceae bacterium]|nr:response regulator [Caldilineaceae bacterium]
MVLVIDDEAALREVIEEILDLSDIPCLAAANGKEGIKLYLENQASIEAILLDMHMPVMSGVDTLQELRKLNPTLTVVLMSGYPESTTMDKLREDRHLFYLEKPFSLEKFNLKMEELLSSHRP